MTSDDHSSRKPLPQLLGSFYGSLDQTSKTTPALDTKSQVESKLLRQTSTHGCSQQQENNAKSPRPGVTPRKMPVNETDEALQGAEARIRDMQLRLDDATAALASLHSTDQFRLGDDRIARVRDELRHDIRQWSRNFHQPPKKSGFAKVLKDVYPGVEECPFEPISTDYIDYMAEDNEKGPSMLVQGYVWKNLLVDVFGCWVWMGGQCLKGGRRDCPLYESSQHLENAAYDANKNPSLIKNYHHWRAETARVLGSCSLRHQDCINRSIAAITKKMLSDLKDYTEKKHIFGDNETNNGRENLAAIVRAAVAFDLILYQKKADFRFIKVFSKKRMKVYSFDPAWMVGDNYTGEDEQILMRNGTTVTLFCAPPLYKFGTSEGENYGESTLVCKAVVDCLMNSAGR